MSSTPNLKISEGEDRGAVGKAIQKLVTESNWELLNGNAIQKTFHCRNWTKVMDFFNLVGIHCKSVNHHANTQTTYSSITFLWTTHSPPGLSQKDVHMADLCEDYATKVIKTVSPDKAPSCQDPQATKD